MNKYIATFFSHFGATRFKKELEKSNIKCELKPVPRSVSSSCGTCALYEYDNTYVDNSMPDFIHKIFLIDDKNNYIIQYEAKDK